MSIVDMARLIQKRSQNFLGFTPEIVVAKKTELGRFLKYTSLYKESLKFCNFNIETAIDDLIDFCRTNFGNE